MAHAENEEVSTRLAAELRDYVRALGPFPLFSREWFDMVDSLQHLTNIALMEQMLPKAAPNATLWERDELTVRFLLEEGKLNLCVRLIVEYKKYMSTNTPNSVLVQASAVGLRMDWKKLSHQLDVFEQSMGLLLNCAFKSIESLQTTDMPLLVGHCAAMLKVVETDPERWTLADVEKRQESLVILYLLSILRKLDDLQEDTIMQEIQTSGICMMIVNIMHKCFQAVPKQVVIACCQLVSLIMDTEAYKTHPDRFVPESQKIAVVQLGELFIEKMFTEYEAKKKIQALLHNIERFKLALGMDI